MSHRDIHPMGDIAGDDSDVRVSTELDPRNKESRGKECDPGSWDNRPTWEDSEQDGEHEELHCWWLPGGLCHSGQLL